MKSFSAVSCALALLAILNIASAKSMCTPMDPKMKAAYEKVYDTDFMGCSLSTGEGMTAMSRLNWLTPVGNPPLVEMDTSAASGMDGMSKMKGGSMMMAAVKVAGASVSRQGYLTVSSECVDSLEPDYVYSLLAKSVSPKVFNAELAAACGGTVRNIKSTTRMADDMVDATTSLAVALICIIASILGLFFPFFDASVIAALKVIVENAFAVLPSPSVTARTIESIASS